MEDNLNLIQMEDDLNILKMEEIVQPKTIKMKTMVVAPLWVTKYYANYYAINKAIGYIISYAIKTCYYWRTGGQTNQQTLCRYRSDIFKAFLLTLGLKAMLIYFFMVQNRPIATNQSNTKNQQQKMSKSLLNRLLITLPTWLIFWWQEYLSQ